VILLALAARAAEGPGAWTYLNDAGVIEAGGGTPDVAARYCEEGLGNAHADDPLRGDLLYCVARDRLQLGDVNGAMAALHEIPAVSPAWAPAHGLLDKLRLQEEAIPRLPATCTFDRDVCGFVRAWEMLDKGLLEAREVGDAAVLAWDTTVRETEDDRIAVAFGTDVALHAVSFRARATRFDADLRVAVVEGSGARFLGPIVQVPAAGWITVSLPVSAFRPVDTVGARATPRGVRLLEITDLTGTLLVDRGANTLLLDDLELR
jgi:hypothetical protein